MSKKYTITKRTATVYKFRHESGMYWADIVLDYEGSKGRISISSDYGAWQCFWAGATPDFLTFLSTLTMEYAADKFQADDWFDNEATVLKFKQMIISKRRKKTFSSKKARVMWDNFKEFEDEENRGVFESEFYRSGLSDVFDYPEVVTTVVPQFKSFWENVWPVFIQQLKSENLIS